MKLKNQVVSLELAKKLKKARYKQEGLWWWEVDLLSIGHKPEHKIIIPYTKEKIQSIEFEYCVAPTVAELGERLPREVYTLRTMQWAVTSKIFDEVYLYADTEANARAKMWLYLKENNLKGE